MYDKKPYATLDINGVFLELSATELLFIHQGLFDAHRCEQADREEAFNSECKCKGELLKNIAEKIKTLEMLTKKISDAVRESPPETMLLSGLPNDSEYEQKMNAETALNKKLRYASVDTLANSAKHLADAGIGDAPEVLADVLNELDTRMEKKDFEELSLEIGEIQFSKNAKYLKQIDDILRAINK